MNRFDIRRLLAAVFAAFVALSLAACGGHSAHEGAEEDSGSSSDSSASSSTSVTDPSINVAGSWVTYMDNTELGITTFKMAASGAISGTLRTGSGETASVSGHLAGKTAEYTMKFEHRTYLASVDFAGDGTTAEGTLVSADGHVHALKLRR